MTGIERAAAFLRREPGVVAGYAFGSVPEGRAHRESDLDLAVLLDWKLFVDRASRGAKQVELLSKLLRAVGSNRIDLVVLNDAPPLLGRRIVRAGQRLHCADASLVQDFERDVQLRAADVEPFIQRGRSRLLDELGA